LVPTECRGASPVWFAAPELDVFICASKPGAPHSRNVAENSRVSLVIFDSSRASGEGSALNVSADAELVDNPMFEDALAVYNAGSVERGLGEWDPAKLREPAKHRLYRAVTLGHSCSTTTTSGSGFRKGQVGEVLADSGGCLEHGVIMICGQKVVLGRAHRHQTSPCSSPTPPSPSSSTTAKPASCAAPPPPPSVTSTATGHGRSLRFPRPGVAHQVAENHRTSAVRGHVYPAQVGSPRDGTRISG
jgi:Pyridoxamine 5'-phosphate oxidase